MRTIKRLTAVLLSLVMTVLLTVPAFAQTGNYSITITPTTTNHTYAIYQIFSGDISGDDTTTEGISGYTLANIQWGSGVNNPDTFLAALKEKNSAKYDVCTTAVDVANQLTDAAALEEFLDVLNDGYLGNAVQSVRATGKTVTINLTEAGYYLVKDRLTGDETNESVSDYIVQVLGEETMKPKSTDIPEVYKKVQEEDYAISQGFGTGYSDVADYEIGESVPFKLIGSIPDMSAYDSYTYTFHDTLSSGLTLNQNTVQVYLVDNYDTDTLGTALNNSYYSTDFSPENGESFTVNFRDLKAVPGAAAEKYIVITYTAELNKSAEIGTRIGNPNEVYLEYSNNPNADSTGKTEEDYVVVFTWTLGVDKVDGETDTRLAEADFVLLNEEMTQVAILTNDRGELRLSRWSDLPTGKAYDEMSVEDWKAITVDDGEQVVMMSNGGTVISVRGLDDDIYYLYEIEAPTGYNRIEDPIKMDIQSVLNHEGTYTSGNATDMLTKLELYVADSSDPQTCNFKEIGNVNCTIENFGGATLPETGGIGTTIFFVLGGLLIVGAGVLLVVRFRMKAFTNK